MGKKLGLGFFSFASCEGCTILAMNLFNSRLPELRKKLEFVYINALQEKNTIREMDAAFVEGAIMNEEGKKKLEEIRKNASKLVVIGTCAAGGWPSNQRNFFTGEPKEEAGKRARELNQFEKVMLPKDFVKIDVTLTGCPISLEEFEKTLNSLLKEFKIK